MIIVNNTIINFKGAKRLDLNYSNHYKKKRICDIIEVLSNATVIIIAIIISNQYILCLKVT